MDLFSHAGSRDGTDNIRCSLGVNGYEFLNDLSYLKSKQIYDKQLLDELKNAHF
jgi:hypothetical protein